MILLGTNRPEGWVRTDRNSPASTESGYETFEPEYESSGYETSMGTRRLPCRCLVTKSALFILKEKSTMKKKHDVSMTACHHYQMRKKLA